MKRFVFYFFLCVYSVLMLLAQPLIAVYLWKRSRKQVEYLQGWGQRFLAEVPLNFSGLASSKRVWVHAVSVGETHAISPLVHAWAKQNPDHMWIFSSTTPTGQATAKQLFSGLKGAQFFYLPYDLPWLMARCLKRIKANQLWLVETELWPNLLYQSKRLKMKVCLLNARVSPRTEQRLKQLSWISSPFLSLLDCLVCQTVSDAAVFESLGRNVDGVCGNLKFDVAHKPELASLGAHWKQQQSNTPVLLFASSREGEEALLLDCMVRSQFFKRAPHVSVWFVPRHPQRFNEVYALLEQAAAKLGVARPARRSEWGSANGPEKAPVSRHLVLGDSMGEMPAYYSVADLALLGGSWLPFGGQNLIEACAYGCPIWMGPHTYNFTKAADDALSAGAARRFEGLSAACSAFLDEFESIVGASERALNYAKQHVGATQATLQILMLDVSRP